MTARRLAAGIALLGAVLAVWLARPGRFVIDGLSMAPGLMPGDVVSTDWLPAADRLLAPARLDRWLVAAPDGSRAVKRIAGLPGEAVAIRDGDLVVDGTAVLKGPAALADLAVPLVAVLDVRHGRAMLPDDEVLDDVAFAREVSRPLEAVRDVGLVAAIATGTAAAWLRGTVDGARIQWRLPAAAAVRAITGRLDGHIVAVAWRDRTGRSASDRRSGLPTRVPEAWAFVSACPADRVEGGRPQCSLTVEGDARIDRASGWRDVHLRPAADGVATWQLDDDSYLVLGDFPTGSIDSRQWGPLPAAAFRCRIQLR